MGQQKAKIIKTSCLSIAIHKIWHRKVCSEKGLSIPNILAIFPYVTRGASPLPPF